MSKQSYKILIALPDNKYFNWQMLVQMNNFKKMGYLDKTTYVVGVKDMENISPFIQKLIEYEIVDVKVYLDERPVKPYMYASSLRPHILKKYFREYPNEADAYFYVDPDLLFTSKMKFTDLIKNDNWYVSDTRSYLDSNYIKSKGERLFLKMCEIADIDPDVVVDNDKNAGGAQYLLKNVDYDFWQEVEFLSGQLYSYMRSTSNKYSPEHPIQAWTADMWAIIWIAWKRGINTKIIKRFNFAWATDRIANWDKTNMFHNAGVFNQDYLFKKSTFNSRHPFNENFDYVSEDFCSYNFVKEIEETKDNYDELIRLL